MIIAKSVYGVHLDKNNRPLLVFDTNSLLWGFPGGRVEAGETDKQALIRELLEETGLLAGGTFQLIGKQSDHIKIRLFYRIDMVDGVLRREGNDDDVSEAGFFSVNELANLTLAPGVKAVIDSVCSKHMNTK